MIEFLREVLTLLKCDHTLRWRDGVGVTVKNENFGFDGAW